MSLDKGAQFLAYFGGYFGGRGEGLGTPGGPRDRARAGGGGISRTPKKGGGGGPPQGPVDTDSVDIEIAGPPLPGGPPRILIIRVTGPPRGTPQD